jgi:hypothetical protein
MRDEGSEKEPPDGGDRFTVAEISNSIDRLTDPDMARLVAASQLFSSFCGIDAEDLLQESFKRSLDGARTCGRGTNIVAFLCGVMQSLASQESEARKAGFRPVLVHRNGVDVVPDVAADTVSPEQAAIAAIDDRADLLRIEKLVSSDEDLQLLIEGLGENMRGTDLEQLLSTDEKGLATLRKRLRRLLRCAFPNRIAS